jgi:hypothetical protein
LAYLNLLTSMFHTQIAVLVGPTAIDIGFE